VDLLSELKVESLPSPNTNEFELSIFGKGYGECIVAHIGDSKWIIIDSFLRPNSNIPVALEYLDAIGVPYNNVHHIIITHWHDDHCKGAATLFEKCSRAQFHVSSALQQNEFRQLVTLFYKKNFLTEKQKSGVQELGRVFQKALSERDEKKPLRLYFVGPKTIIENSLAKIYALSPSAMENLEALVGFGKLMPKMGSQLNPIPNPKENNCAIALWLECSGVKAILGADLEEPGSEDKGWSAICGLNPQIMSAASVFKIPHHGSKTAHHHEIWEKYTFGKQSHAFLTPFNRGRTKLPTREDVSRIKEYSDSVWCTSTPGTIQKVKRPLKVQRTLDLVTKKTLSSVSSALGLIRLRSVGNDIAIDRIGAARVL
jgi:beta-lactamase superfamily II metal-dependent hydrolase